MRNGLRRQRRSIERQASVARARGRASDPRSSPPIFLRGQGARGRPAAAIRRPSPAEVAGPYGRHLARLSEPSYEARAWLDPDAELVPPSLETLAVDASGAVVTPKGSHWTWESCFVDAVMEAAEIARNRDGTCCGPGSQEYNCDLNRRFIEYIADRGLAIPRIELRDGRLFTPEFRRIAQRGTINFDVNTPGRRRLTHAEQDFFLYCLSFLIANLEWVRLTLAMSIPRGNRRDKNWFADIRDDVLLRTTTGPRVFEQRIDVQIADGGSRGCSMGGGIGGAFASRGCVRGCNVTFCDHGQGDEGVERLAPFVGSSIDAVANIEDGELGEFMCNVVRVSALMLHEFLHLVDFGGSRGVTKNDTVDACHPTYILESNFRFLTLTWLKLVEGLGRCTYRDPCADVLYPAPTGCMGDGHGCAWLDDGSRLTAGERDADGRAGLWRDSPPN